MVAINEINAAINHKPFNPASAAHKKFCQTNLEKINKLQAQYSYINFDAEAALFS
jgi:hypothetical protein